MDTTQALNDLIDAAHKAAAAREASGGFYTGSASAQVAGHKVTCCIEPNTRNGRGLKRVVSKGWYLDGKRTSVAKVMTAVEA